MKSKAVLLLLTSIGLLGGYAVYDYKSSQKAEQTKAEQAKLVPFKKDQITEVLIEKGFNRFFMKRDVDGWHIEEPLKDWADSESVDIFLATLESEASIDIAKEGSEIDWALYGLDKPQAKITLKSSTGEILLFQVSGLKNYAQQTYLRKNEENKVYVVNETWQARGDKGVAELRDLRLLRHKMASIQKLDLKTSAGRLVLELKEGRWQRPEQPDKKVDQNRVYHLMQSIADTRAEKIISESAPTEIMKKHYALKEPVAELKLKLGDKSWSAVFGQKENKEMYASVSDPVFFMKIETGNVDKYFSVKPDDYFEQEKK